jgi:hypothetical protein
MSKKKILTTVASLLATASLVIPATAAQASVEWHANGVVVGTTPVGTTLWGNLEAQNSVFGNVKCHVIGTLPVWNEGGLAKVAVELLATGSCTSEPTPCPGVFLTAEAPVEAILRETTKREKVAEAKRGPMSLPWHGEGTEKQEGAELVKGVSISGVKLTMVVPCFSTEVQFEGTLELPAFNGTKNGLKPMHMIINDLKRRPTECLASKTLSTEKENNILCLVGEVKDVGESMQLITLE